MWLKWGISGLLWYTCLTQPDDMNLQVNDLKKGKIVSPNLQPDNTQTPQFTYIDSSFAKGSSKSSGTTASKPIGGITAFSPILALHTCAFTFLVLTESTCVSSWAHTLEWVDLQPVRTDGQYSNYKNDDD